MLKLGQSLGTRAKPVAGLPIDEISSAPQGAWSLRKLSSTYTGPVLIANSTSGYTATVYFDANGELSLNSPTNMGSYGYPTLKDWAWNEGDGNLWVSTWYDQSGGTTRNATQTVAGDMPILTEGGVLVKQGSFLFADDYFKVLNYKFPNPNDSCTILAVARPTNSDAMGIVTDIETFNDGVELIYASNSWDWRIKNSDLNNNPIDPVINGKFQIAIAVYDTSLGSNQQKLYVNGILTQQNCTEDKHVASTDRFRIGARITTSNQMDGNIAEAMIWDAALSEADIHKLQHNIFMHYSIPKGSP